MKNVILCRLYQLAIYIGEFLMPWREPVLIKGKGSFNNLPTKIKEDGIDSVLIVTDKGLMGLKMLDGLFASLDAEGVRYELYDEVVPNPTVDNIEAALALYKKGNCSAIIAVGGGSPMDCAKGVGARVARPDKPLSKMGGILKVMRKLPPLYAVPTTSGTGSETTLACVVTDPVTSHKYAINDPSLIPYFAVLDPLLTAGLPKHITSTTGMDALCHATEAYLGWENVPSTKRNAKEAIVLIHDNLLKAYENGQDLEARENMQKASYQAGLAFTRAYVGYVHAIAHSLGGKYHIAHGLANAVIMPYVFEAYGKKAHKKLAELADLIHLSQEGDSVSEKASRYIEWIRELNRKMNIPEGFDMIKEEDLDEMAGYAGKEGNPLYPVPKIMGKDELKDIYKKLIIR